LLWETEVRVAACKDKQGVLGKGQRPFGKGPNAVRQQKEGLLGKDNKSFVGENNGGC
jgi:hypothetical protein